MRFIFQSDRWRSKGIICRKAEITLRQQGKQERSARPRKRDGLPRERKTTKVEYLFLRFCQKYYDAGRAPLCGKIITEKKIGW